MWAWALLLGLGGACPLPAVTMTPPAHPLSDLVWHSHREGREGLPIEAPPSSGATNLGCRYPAPANARDSPLMPFPLHPYFPT